MGRWLKINVITYNSERYSEKHSLLCEFDDWSLCHICILPVSLLYYDRLYYMTVPEFLYVIWTWWLMSYESSDWVLWSDDWSVCHIIFFVLYQCTAVMALWVIWQSLSSSMCLSYGLMDMMTDVIWSFIIWRLSDCLTVTVIM